MRPDCVNADGRRRGSSDRWWLSPPGGAAAATAAVGVVASDDRMRTLGWGGVPGISKYLAADGPVDRTGTRPTLMAVVRTVDGDSGKSHRMP
jgi:hypothetical protein